MKLYKPLQNYIISQKFGENADPAYKEQGLLGHTGLDLQSIDGYDSIVEHSASGLVYKVLNKNNPDLSFYRAVFVLVNDGSDWYEVSYGHLDKIYCEAGNTVVVGEPLGTEGNTGLVYAGGILVSEVDKESGSKAGAHTHFQVRSVIRTPILDPTCKFLDIYEGDLGGKNPYKDSSGSYYQVIDPQNGYNGCIDPLSLLNSPDVVELQSQDSPAEIQTEVNIIKQAILWIVSKVEALLNKK